MKKNLKDKKSLNIVYSALIVLEDYIKSRECCKTKTYSF